MTDWIILQDAEFPSQMKRHQSHHELAIALERKLERLRQDPYAVGARLHGPLHGKRSTRLLGRFRLVFRIDENKHAVYLITLDHRGSIYK